jgi:hypothetical protein
MGLEVFQMTPATRLSLSQAACQQTGVQENATLSQKTLLLLRVERERQTKGRI